MRTKRAYDYSCKCGDTVLRANWTGKRCPKCGSLCKKKVARPELNLITVDVASGPLAYQNRFPYVSTAFPFNGAGAKHIGTRGKCVIEDKGHEDRMRHMHGYVGENKVVNREQASKDQLAANRAFYG